MYDKVIRLFQANKHKNVSPVGNRTITRLPSSLTVLEASATVEMQRYLEKTIYYFLYHYKVLALLQKVIMTLIKRYKTNDWSHSESMNPLISVGGAAEDLVFGSEHDELVRFTLHEHQAVLKKTWSEWHESTHSSGNCFLRSEVRWAVASLAFQSDQRSCLLLAVTENAGLTRFSIGFTFSDRKVLIFQKSWILNEISIVSDSSSDIWEHERFVLSSALQRSSSDSHFS